MIGNLNALFSNMSGLKEDLMTYGTIGAGVIGGVVAYNFAFDKLMAAMPSLATAADGKLVTYGKPLGAIALGIFGGQYVSRKLNRNVGQGMAVGLTAAGLLGMIQVLDTAKSLPFNATLQLTQPMLPAASVPPEKTVAGLRAAPVQVEEINGAPITIEAVSGFSGNREAFMTAAGY